MINHIGSETGKKKLLLKIYGERNTGTHYLSELIRMNLDVDQIIGTVPKSVMFLQKVLPGKELIRDIYFDITYPQNLGWKHTRVKSVEELKKYKICSGNLAFVTLTKNPYSWLLSLHTRPYHQYYKKKTSFITFLTSPWETVGRDNSRKKFLSPVDLWNKKNASYLPLKCSFPTLNIRFEDLLDNPQGILELMSQTFSCNWQVERFRNYAQSTKEKEKDTNFYREYYLKEKWKDKLSSRAIAIINERLDDDMMNHFRYERLV